jgi:membrane associated rhomboid family serine protease
MRCPECSRQRTPVTRMRDMATIPRATYTLIALNVIVFLTEQGQFSIYGTGIYGRVVDESFLARAPIAEGHQYWRLVSSGFIHENLLHIAFNMYLLYLLGLLLEPAIGSARFTVIYFTSLLAGSCGVMFATAAPSVGASGAVFGLMGAAVVELRARRIGVMQSGIGGLILINLVLSFTLANISVGAHIGGLLGGFLAATAFRAADNARVPTLGYVACLVLCAVAVGGALAFASSTSSGIV